MRSSRCFLVTSSSVHNKAGFHTSAVFTFIASAFDEMDSFTGYRSFKERRPLDARQNDAVTVREQHPNKIPVIIERLSTEKSVPMLDKVKFLIPEDITMCELRNIIRRRLKLNEKQALYFLVSNRTIASNSATMMEIYEREKDSDGFLYITYASQDTFG